MVRLHCFQFVCSFTCKPEVHFKQNPRGGKECYAGMLNCSLLLGVNHSLCIEFKYAGWWGLDCVCERSNQMDKCLKLCRLLSDAEYAALWCNLLTSSGIENIRIVCWDLSLENYALSKKRMHKGKKQHGQRK